MNLDENKAAKLKNEEGNIAKADFIQFAKVRVSFLGPIETATQPPTPKKEHWICGNCFFKDNYLLDFENNLNKNIDKNLDNNLIVFQGQPPTRLWQRVGRGGLAAQVSSQLISIWIFICVLWQN